MSGVDWKLVRDSKLNQRNRQIRFMRKMIKAILYFLRKAEVTPPLPNKLVSWLEAEAKKK